MDKNKVHLPDLPIPLSEMNKTQVIKHIDLMIKSGEGRSKPEYGKEQFRPSWWPRNLPWENVRYDPRFGNEGPQGSWMKVLKGLVRKCYLYYSREDLLFTADKLHTKDAKGRMPDSTDRLTPPLHRRCPSSHKRNFSKETGGSADRPKVRVTGVSAVDQANFMNGLGLVPTAKAKQLVTCRVPDIEVLDVDDDPQPCPTPQSPRTPRSLISQLSHDHHDHHHKHLDALDPQRSVLSIDFSSPLGLRLGKVMAKQADRLPLGASSGVTIDELCRTPKKCDMVLKLRNQGNCDYQVTFRRTRKNTQSYVHRYKFNRAQLREWWMALHTGLNAKSRALQGRFSCSNLTLRPLTAEDVRREKQKVREEHQRQVKCRPVQPVYPVVVNPRPNCGMPVQSAMIKPWSRVPRYAYQVALTPPKTPSRLALILSPGKVGHSRNPIVIDSDDECCASSLPLPPPPPPAAPKMESLLFRCHMCSSEIPCRGDFSACVEKHYALQHNLTNIKLVRHQDQSGQMVISIVEKDPRGRNRPASAPIRPCRPPSPDIICLD